MRTPDELPPLPASRRPHGPHVDRGSRGRPRGRGGGLVRLRRAEHDAGPLHLRLVHVQQEGRREPEGEAVRRQAQLPAGNGGFVEEDEARSLITRSMSYMALWDSVDFSKPFKICLVVP